MSANSSDEALERLNYFNGQRLVAADLRGEQSYHMGMRRVLNRALYSPGIVTGLEVEPDKADVHRVIVRDGLAFDQLGREIFVPVDVSVQVVGVPSSAPGVVFGNLLAVSYRETRKFPASNTCMVGAPYKPCSGDLAWGAPTRVVADAVFEFLDAWPAADSGKIVLAQIELSTTCSVVRASPAVRKYAVPVKAGKTRALSVVGEQDIAPANAKLLRFHIADGLPDRAVLYLQGAEFSSFWYTELARHGHVVNVVVAGKSWDVNLAHTHDLEGQMEKAGQHRHAYWQDGKNNLGGFKQANGAFDASNSTKISADDINSPLLDLPNSDLHFHELTNVTVGDPSRTSYTITPDFSGTNIEKSGMDPGVRTDETPFRYFEEIEVSLDGIEVTAKILLQIPTIAQLGVGGSATPESELFVTDGTPAIDLTLLGIDLLPGAHTLKFRVPQGKGGGKLYYNLYVD